VEQTIAQHATALSRPVFTRHGSTPMPSETVIDSLMSYFHRMAVTGSYQEATDDVALYAEYALGSGRTS